MNKPDTIDELFGNRPIDRDEIVAALSAMVAEIIGEDEKYYPTDGSGLRNVKVMVNNRKQGARQRAIAKGFTL